MRAPRTCATTEDHHMPTQIGEDGSSAGGSSMAPDECAAVKSNPRTNMRPAKTRTAATGAGIVVEETSFAESCARTFCGGILLRVVVFSSEMFSLFFLAGEPSSLFRCRVSVFVFRQLLEECCMSVIATSSPSFLLLVVDGCGLKLADKGFAKRLLKLLPSLPKVLSDALSHLFVTRPSEGRKGKLDGC